MRNPKALLLTCALGLIACDGGSSSNGGGAGTSGASNSALGGGSSGGTTSSAGTAGLSIGGAPFGGSSGSSATAGAATGGQAASGGPGVPGGAGSGGAAGVAAAGSGGAAGVAAAGSGGAAGVAAGGAGVALPEPEVLPRRCPRSRSRAIPRPSNLRQCWSPPRSSTRERPASVLVGSPPCSATVRWISAATPRTQSLRQSVDHPNLRIIFTVTETFYRIVASRSAGVMKLADLKGKSIATIPNTSAAYYVDKMMRTVGLTDKDVTIRSGTADTLPTLLANGTVAAVTMWEPSPQVAMDRIGSDAIEFQDRSVYREIVSLHSKAETLANPEKRRGIVAFVRSLMEAQRQFREQPENAKPRVTKALSMDAALLDKVWHNEQWLGTPRPRHPRRPGRRRRLGRRADRPHASHARPAHAARGRQHHEGSAGGKVAPFHS